MAPKKTRLRAQLAESSGSEPEAWTVVNFLHRVLAGWRRMVLRLAFLVGTATLDRVGRHWNRTALESDQPQQAAQLGNAAAAPAAKAARKPRRDDLTGVGAPVAPTATAYPANRTTCTHLSPEGETFLRATGGRRGSATMHLWTCKACGSRWERVPAPPSLAPTAPTAAQRSTALVPTGLVRTPVPQAARTVPAPMVIEVDSSRGAER